MNFDVVVIGAGPSGSAVASLIIREGYSVKILEKSQFPRFSIGESLLPHCMVSLQQCGLLDAIPKDVFQIKKGALFAQGNKAAKVDFSLKFTDGPSETWQVSRSEFDHYLLKEAEKSGAQVEFGAEVKEVRFSTEQADITYETESRQKKITAKFVVDASGGAMVLPRLMNTFAQPTKGKEALFCHFKGDSRNLEETENILIAVHPQNHSIWYWGIPLKDGLISVGIVSDSETFNHIPGTLEEKYLHLIESEPNLARRLKSAERTRDISQIKGYEASVKKVHGDRFLLVGNSAGFIDPIFSSGITLGLKSAVVGAPLILKKLKGESVNWDSFDKTMAIGTRTFKTYIDAWYDKTFQDIIFMEGKNPEVQEKINSILAGYVWDTKNPFVREPQRKLQQISKLLLRASGE